MNCPSRDQNCNGDPTWNQNPPPLDSYLVTRSSPIVCGDARTASSAGSYDLKLHVIALFLVLFQSTLAATFPLIIVRCPRLRIPAKALFVVRHFGTGVLIATSFVHLLPTAFVSLTDPCLPAFWNETYPAMAGAIAMVAMFSIVVVEMVFSRSHYVCSGRLDSIVAGPAAAARKSDEEAPEKRAGVGGNSDQCADGADSDGTHEIRSVPLAAVSGALPGNEKRDSSAERPRNRRSASLRRVSRAGGGQAADQDQAHYHGRERYDNTPARQQKLQCMLLEMGILFHSVFIGLALSVETGSAFVVLLIAIIFHQTFEGLALGSRIASLDWSSSPSYHPYIMSLFYGLTTPVGQAAGLATHTLYSPTSTVGLLMVGITNAVSSGLLTFAALVELLAADFLSPESWEQLRGRTRWVACGLVGLGAMAMSLVGAWA